MLSRSHEHSFYLCTEKGGDAHQYILPLVMNEKKKRQTLMISLEREDEFWSLLQLTKNGIYVLLHLLQSQWVFSFSSS